MQNAQQLAMAQQIIQAASAGYQQAYLQAAAAAAVQNAAQNAAQNAVAGKPLASMLSSMAMLQQVQQQQAILSAVPKRGRGSRGGGLGSAAKRGLGLKLKRLESWVYLIFCYKILKLKKYYHF